MQLKALRMISRTVVGLSFVALAALYASEARGQATPKATYIAEHSFELPAKGQPGGPDRPSAMAVGSDGTIHVADDRGLIIVFDASGAYQRAYGRGHIDRPIGVAIAANGEAYVLDANRNQIVVFAPSGQVLRRISSKGGRLGQLADPVDMALGPNGFVYVLDKGKRGVQIFSQDGVFVRQVAPVDAIREPMSVAVGVDGGIYIADKKSPNVVFRFDPFIELPWVETLPRGIGARIAYRGGQFDEPVAMAVNIFGSLLVLDKKDGRVWRANPYSAQIGPNDLLYGGSGTGRGSFSEAVEIAFAGVNEVVILDRKLRKVERIRLTTEDDLRPRPPLNFPIRLAVGARPLPVPLHAIGYGPDGSPRLALGGDRRSVRLVGTQTEYHTTSYRDSVPAYLPNPAALARQFSDIGEAAAVVLNDTIAVVADSRRDRFVIFDIESGASRGSFGDNYRDNRRLSSPQGVALLSDGRVVVTDTGNDKVKIFSADLASLVASYPVPGAKGVDITPSGTIVVWDKSGNWVGALRPGGERFEPLLQGLLPGPVASIAIDGAGNIYLADEGAGRTLVYRWDVQYDGMGTLSVDYLEDAAELNWRSGPEGFVSHYQIEGSSNAAGPYSILGTTPAPPVTISEEGSEGSLPQYVRVAPVFITGVAGQATPAFPLFNFTVAAAYRRGEYQGAQTDARLAVDLMNSGALEADNETKSAILYYAFASAYQLRDYPGAVDWAQLLAPVVTRTHIIDFLFKLAEVHLQLGDGRMASQRILTLVGQGPRPEYYMNQAVVEQSFRIYRALRNSGYAADGLEYLRLYAQSMPATIPDLQATYRDSITVFSTRTKLASGFEHWRNASFGEAVGFFENMLLTAELSAEQKVISRQILAAAYYAFGRRSDAEDTFREIYRVRPSFDLGREIPRVRTLYGLIIYNPETRSFFGQLRTRS